MAALRELCQVDVRLQSVRKWIAENGSTYVTVNKLTGLQRRVAHPEVRMEAELSKRYLMRLTEFGLTPSSQPHVRPLQKPAPDPMAEFFGGSPS